MIRDYIQFSLNGQIIELSDAQAFLTLTDFLRYEMDLTGTKVVCAEGDCGACTVLIANSKQQPLQFQPINACVTLCFNLDGYHILTIEGVSPEEGLSEIQNAMVRNFASQCGFCTPGFVMSLEGLHHHKCKPNCQQVKNALTGNLCRCTGYESIIQSALDVDTAKVKPLAESYDFNSLGKSFSTDSEAIQIQWQDHEFYAPNNLKSALEYKQNNADAEIYSGGTDLGVQLNKGFKSLSRKILSLQRIDELHHITQKDNKVIVGAQVTIHQLQDSLKDKAPSYAEFFNIFASLQIKNSATLIGNIANASPVADSTPYLICTEAVIHLQSAKSKRELPLESFFLDYKKLDLATNEIITHISVEPADESQQIVGLYKVSQRRDLDISSVNACFILQFKDEKIIDTRIAYGGVAATVIRLKNLEDQLIGKALTPQLVDDTENTILSSLHPLSDLRGSAEFRSHMAVKLFQKYLKEKCHAII